jgi:xylulokinase
MPRFIGIDVGSSFLKAALLDPDTGTLARIERVPFPDFEPGLPPLHREVDPAAILRAVEALLAPLAAEPCGGLVLCGQMHGFILVNSRGEAVSNYISWLDQRVARSEFDEMAALVPEDVRHQIGNEFRPAIALAQLYWLRRHGALSPGDVTPVSIADFVAARLCNTVPIMDPTQAAAFGALRLDMGEWHQSLIAALGLEKLCWPSVRPSGTAVGRWQGARCFTSVGDQQCALAGALLRDRELSINIGTGSQVAILADAAGPVPFQTRPYFDGRFLRTITHIPAGRALSALIALLTELGGVSQEEAWRKIEQAVAAVPSTDLRAAITFFPGPCGDRGHLENLHEGNLTVGHVFRAVFDSMAVNYQSCSRRLDPAGTAETIVFSGGVARHLPELCERTRQALNLPARLSPDPEDTLYGLMVLAAAFSGRAGSVRDATAMFPPAA